ncbi:hypothetical protein ETD86_45210 [Nonomuraea turkmeniaca]|uniref:Uncharacterized protein n=1 Tax=Nonomuraea turkmeniaca TaxID=103838 RepID=A0A5S4EZI0_9ACTN|nr:hypothetical protein [Nonomuraea turkmeniaca]TMR09054.1 hypothetical protein ETD86_45210 [Nonomuraea turkmeniaca]
MTVSNPWLGRIFGYWGSFTVEYVDVGQLLAGSQTDAELAPATTAGLNLWIGEVEQALGRVPARSPLAEFVDVPGLAKAVAAAFVGLELYKGVDAEGADQALNALEELAVLVTAVEDMGPLVRRAVRTRLRRRHS